MDFLSDSYTDHGESTNSKSATHLHLSLQTSVILRDFTESMISDCTESIFESIFNNNISSIFHFIVENANEHQLNVIYSILKKRKLEEADHEQVDKTNTNTSNFNTISTNSVENICNFLDRSDITNFKCSSRRIAVICLDVMNKYTVGICYAQDLMNANYKHHTIEFKDYMFWPKYNINTTFSSIFQDVETLNVMQKYQLPIAKSNDDYYFSIDPLQTISPQTQLIFLDKRKVILLDKNGYRAMNENDTFDFYENYIVELHHFNVYHPWEQEMELIQYIMINKSITYQNIIKFVQDHLLKDIIENINRYSQNININTAQLSLFRLLRNTECEFHENQKNCHDITNIDDIVCEDSRNICNTTIISIIFQLNLNETESKRLKKDFECTNLLMFYGNPYQYIHSNEYNDRKRKIKIQCDDMDTVKEQVGNYLIHKDQTEDDVEEALFCLQYAFENGGSDWERNEWDEEEEEEEKEEEEEEEEKKREEEEEDKPIGLRIRMSWGLRMDTLKQYLSTKYLHGIPPNNIKLSIDLQDEDRYYGRYRYDESEDMIMPNMCLQIVPFHLYKDAKYSIDIYGPNKTPFPYNMPKHNAYGFRGCGSRWPPSTTINIEYKKSFTVKELVNYLQELISNPLFIDRFHRNQDILDNINGVNSNSITCFAQKGWKYRFYSLNDKLTYDGDNNGYSYCIKLFMVNNVRGNNSELKHLKIQFVWNKRFNSNIPFDDLIKENITFIGLPLTVWINRNYTINDVINNNEILKEIQDDIVTAFQICDKERKIILITKSEMDSYDLHSNIKPNDFIVITISDYDFDRDYEHKRWKWDI